MHLYIGYYKGKINTYHITYINQVLSKGLFTSTLLYLKFDLFNYQA